MVLAAASLAGVAAWAETLDAAASGVGLFGTAASSSWMGLNWSNLDFRFQMEVVASESPLNDAWQNAFPVESGGDSVFGTLLGSTSDGSDTLSGFGGSGDV